MSGGILDVLPSAIRAQCEEKGFNNNPIHDDWQSLAHFPDELLRAYRVGDHGVIRQIQQNAADDLHPMYENIKKHGKDAFVEMTANGESFMCALSGPASAPTGCMLVWNDKKTVGPFKTDGEKQNNDFYIGTISFESKVMGIVKSVWNDLAIKITDGIVATVTAILGGWLTRRLAGAGIQEAAVAAAEETGASLASEGAIDAAVAGEFAAAASTLVVSLAVGAGVFILTMVLMQFLKKHYEVVVEFQNYDEDSDYVVTDCYLDNGFVSGHVPFHDQKLTHPQSMKTVSFPGGISAEVKDKLIPNGTFVFENDSQWMQGLGVALTVKREKDGSMFQIKYLCSWAHENNIGIAADGPGSSQFFYGDAATWAASGSYTTATEVGRDTKVAVRGTTNALSKEPNCVYTFSVVIGTPPAFLSAPTTPTEGQVGDKPVKAPTSYPSFPVPSKGDIVRFPGCLATVVGPK
ncbi:hypothetical protein KEM52_004637 [Ascosphaera acerosa]|nr:hypothetical protein KEM52_004637 [Ascosphaera acerosa]